MATSVADTIQVPPPAPRDPVTEGLWPLMVDLRRSACLDEWAPSPRRIITEREKQEDNDMGKFIVAAVAALLLLATCGSPAPRAALPSPASLRVTLYEASGALVCETLSNDSAMPAKITFRSTPDAAPVIWTIPPHSSAPVCAGPFESDNRSGEATP